MITKIRLIVRAPVSYAALIQINEDRFMSHQQARCFNVYSQAGVRATSCLFARTPGCLNKEIYTFIKRPNRYPAHR